MRVCAELIDLGMDLARLAAARARTELTDPDTQSPATEPAPTEPAETQTETALVATLRKAIKSYARPPSDKPPTCKPLSAAQIFIRLTAAIRACVALEARLAAGTAGTTRPPADPRRTDLRDAFHLVTKNHPARTDLIRAATARLDEELAADPNQTLDVRALLFIIADAVGIDIDLATLPDKYLGFPPDPRATSPP
jgi:hypothetical protein